jgi:RimJ/RimL family protein N-acetyltransferase
MDSLIIRALNENDYEEILTGWWTQWGWKAPFQDFLPDNGKGGLLVLDGDIPVCAGFMYLTNSRVAWVDWIISNKEYTNRAGRKEALRLLVDSLTNICKSTGAKYVYALIKNESLIKTYEEIGYLKGDSYTNEMIKVL